MFHELVDGWFRYFGPPLSMVVDAEGALRGNSQCVAFQMHIGSWASVRGTVVDRTRVDKPVCGLEREEMDLMAVHAKNSLVRRCGASPCQWVFGRQPRVSP